MARDLTLPDPSPVIDLLYAYRKSQILFAACELGVFESLVGGAKSLDTLAAELRANADALERLLGGCVGLGLLVHTPAGFANTPTATAYLTAASPNRMLGYGNFSAAVLWKLWDHLPDAIREGTHRWKQTYGTDGPIFSQFFRDDTTRREFLMGMHGFGKISSPQVVAALDLSRFRTFVDVGGATGHLAEAACRRYPQMRGIVFDLPEAIPLAKEVIAATDVADRISFAAGDFFKDALPAGDLYALGRILHDWNPEQNAAILAKIYAAAPVGGGVLVCEKILHDDKSGPEPAVLQSLNMLVCTEGKERTLGEYEQLLTAAGFREVTACRTGSPLDAILAVK